MGRASIFWVLCSTLACSVEPGGMTTGITTYDPVSTTTPIPTTSTSTGNPESGDVTETDATSSTTSDHPSTSGPMPDFGGEGCSKIDVLYVLSQTMPAELRESVREGLVYFNEQLLGTFANLDLHLLVTDEMIDWSGDVCKEQCENEGHCNLTGDPDFPCDALKFAHPCEAKRGAGHTFPIGKSPMAVNRPCVSNNAQYLRSSTPDLAEKLDCITQADSFDGLADYAPNAMQYAVLNNQAPVDGCNTGFLRDDAVLVVVFVAAASNDGNDARGPSDWAETLFAAKGGNQDAVGLIALIWDTTAENPVCQPALDPANPTETVQFVRDHVPHRVMGSICEEDTKPVFEAGVALMLELCEQYVPQ